MIMSQKENIVISTSCNDNYIPYLSTLLISIMECSSNEYNYEILVIDIQNTEKMKRRIIEMCSDIDNFSVKFIKVNDKILNEIEKCQISNGTQSWSKELYGSLITPYVLNEYDKAIFLDCDIINLRDFSQLYSTELGDKLIAVSRSVGRSTRKDNGFLSENVIAWEKEKEMDAFTGYFNNGVMLLNLKELRKTYSLEYVLNFISSQKYALLDQDTWNVLCKDRIEYVDAGWNWRFYTVSEFNNLLKLIPNNLKDYFIDGYNNPKNIHYITPQKPWVEPYGEFIEPGMLFWKYAKKSPFYEELLENLYKCQREKVYLFYHYENKEWNEFESSLENKKLYLYGYGTYGKQIINKYGEKYSFCGIIDNKKENIVCSKYNIFSLKDFTDDVKDKENTVILISNQVYIPILKQLDDLGYKNIYIYACMEQINWVMGTKSRKQAVEAAGIFADEKSERVYGTLINKRINYNFNRNIKCVDICEGNMYFYNELLKKEHYGTYLDVGINSKEVSKKFMRCISAYDSIIASEQLSDDLIKKIRKRKSQIGLIRIDIVEIEILLERLEDIIKTDRPYMTINISHSGKDLWNIPIYMSKKYNFYDLYIRHHDAMFGNTVLYVVNKK